jgi:hypothetical protein
MSMFDGPGWPHSARETLKRTREELRILDSTNGIKAWERTYGANYPGPGYRRVLVAQRDRLVEELRNGGEDEPAAD